MSKLDLRKYKFCHLALMIDLDFQGRSHVFEIAFIF